MTITTDKKPSQREVLAAELFDKWRLGEPAVDPTPTHNARVKLIIAIALDAAAMVTAAERRAAFEKLQALAEPTVVEDLIQQAIDDAAPSHPLVWTKDTPAIDVVRALAKAAEVTLVIPELRHSFVGGFDARWAPPGVVLHDVLEFLLPDDWRTVVSGWGPKDMGRLRGLMGPGNWKAEE